MRVWVAQLEAVDGAGWTSVHETATSARQRLHEKVAAWGLGHLESDAVRFYSVSEYEVEP